MTLPYFFPHFSGQIGYLGSFAIAVNSLTGPAMLHLPATFQRSGVIPTLATLIFICILAALCSLHLADTISKVPGNSNFKQEVRSLWSLVKSEKLEICSHEKCNSY
jgi:amino acid permease